MMKTRASRHNLGKDTSIFDGAEVLDIKQRKTINELDEADRLELAEMQYALKVLR